MADIGSLLRETRMRERIDITTVESATKIRAKYLRALENEEWDLLPGPTFVRTFLRTYGDYLGLDSKMLVEEYKQRFEQPGPQDLMPYSSRGNRPGRQNNRPPRSVPPWLIVGGVVVLLLAALFALGTFGSDDEPEVAAESTATATATPDRQAARRERRQERRRQQAASQPKQVNLVIVPEAEVNVCLVAGDGEVLIGSENLTEPSDRFTGKRFRVGFGNGLVVMRVNGEAFPVEDTDGAVGFDLRPGRDPKPLPADDVPSCV